VPDFECPGDGQHSFSDPRDDWRQGDGIVDRFKRLVSYGNYAGPGNRILEENKDYVEEQRRLDPSYNENRDPRFMTDRYKPIDGLDEIAKEHDTGYPDHLKPGQDMFSWDGMRAVQEDDRRLANDTNKEMAANRACYSEGAQRYAAGMEGFFGGRVMGLDAVDWVGNKASEAGQGISSFVDGAAKWDSVDDAIGGIGKGFSSAMSWLGATGTEAADGVEQAGEKTVALGAPGILATAAGLGNVAVAGAGHLAGEALDGVAGAGKRLLGGASDLWHHFAD
jgi:hypothetical protein